jgi:hypothetical protein
VRTKCHAHIQDLLLFALASRLPERQAQSLHAQVLGLSEQKDFAKHLLRINPIVQARGSHSQLLCSRAVDDQFFTYGELMMIKFFDADQASSAIVYADCIIEWKLTNNTRGASLNRVLKFIGVSSEMHGSPERAVAQLRFMNAVSLAVIAMIEIAIYFLIAQGTAAALFVLVAAYGGCVRCFCATALSTQRHKQIPRLRLQCEGESGRAQRHSLSEMASDRGRHASLPHAAPLRSAVGGRAVRVHPQEV